MFRNGLFSNGEVTPRSWSDALHQVVLGKVGTVPRLACWTGYYPSNQISSSDGHISVLSTNEATKKQLIGRSRALRTACQDI